MNRFVEVIHGVKAWLQRLNIKPENVQVVLRFRSPADLAYANAALIREFDPMLGHVRPWDQDMRKGSVTGQRYELELEHGALDSAHSVAEALRQLADEVEPRTPRRPPPVYMGDVLGPFTPPPHLDRLAAHEVPETLGDEGPDEPRDPRGEPEDY